MPVIPNVVVEESDGQAYRITEYADPGEIVHGAEIALKAAKPVARAVVAGGKIAYQTIRTAHSMVSDPSSKLRKLDKHFGQASGAVASMAATAALKIRKGQIAKIQKQCEKETGMAQKTCYNKIRRDAMRKEITALSVSKRKCEYTNKPDSCLKKIDDRIKEIQKQKDTFCIFIL